MIYMSFAKSSRVSGKQAKEDCLRNYLILFFVSDLLVFNPFVPNVPFLYSQKALENRKVFWCFQGVEKSCIGNEWVNVKVLKANNEKTYKSSHQYILLIMSHQPADFVGDGSWLVNLWKGLKVESILKV